MTGEVSNKNQTMNFVEIVSYVLQKHEQDLHSPSPKMLTKNVKYLLPETKRNQSGAPHPTAMTVPAAL